MGAVNEIKGSNPLSCEVAFDMIYRGVMDADGQINESHDFISNTVQASLSKLLETLRKAEPFFVRCIRSNGDKVWWRAVVSFVYWVMDRCSVINVAECVYRRKCTLMML